MNREVQVRICEGLGVEFPGPTRRKPPRAERRGRLHQAEERFAFLNCLAVAICIPFRRETLRKPESGEPGVIRDACSPHRVFRRVESDQKLMRPVS